MSVLIVGTTALDSIKTPTKENPRLLGGSASHAAVNISTIIRMVRSSPGTRSRFSGVAQSERS